MTEQTPLELKTRNTELETNQPACRSPLGKTRNRHYRFDPVDLEQMRLLGCLPPGRRVRVMLEARELAVGLITKG